MKQIQREKYVEGVKSIYVEKPGYELGHDGSDGKCDCIGMVRGGLDRAGAKDVKNLSGTNRAARKAINNLQQIAGSAELMVGDVVLKTRDKDDKSMPLPDRYREGGADYDARLGETNFTHIGTVTRVYPLEITHMTSPTAKVDTKLGNWSWFGELPWVEYEAAPEPEPEPEPLPAMTAVVTAESGNSVKMRAKPSTRCSMYWDVPVGTVVDLIERGDSWSRIRWKGISGYMMTKFLKIGKTILWTVHIPHMTQDQAQAIINRYAGAWMTSEGGAVG